MEFLAKEPFLHLSCTETELTLGTPHGGRPGPDLQTRQVTNTASFVNTVISRDSQEGEGKEEEEEEEEEERKEEKRKKCFFS